MMTTSCECRVHVDEEPECNVIECRIFRPSLCQYNYL